MRNAIVAAVLIASLAACAITPGERALVVGTAPRVSEFTFDSTPPLTSAGAFAPWAELAASNSAETSTLENCIAERDLCANGHLLRYRRLLELAAGLPQRDQLRLVQEYFNSIDQILQPAGKDDWASLYRVASSNEGDCKAVALGKYFTLRRLGWQPDDLRVVMNWDDQVLDWHALLAVRIDDETYVLDSILGLQEPRDFRYAYMVYSISETGIWDHAPDFVPVL
jgi:predicted transglutaminase-like cysteine proteinase